MIEAVACPAGEETILRMEGITKIFPGVKALENVDLSVRCGTIHAICGENGAGKSTLIKVLSGIYAHGSYDGKIHPRRTGKNSLHRHTMLKKQELSASIRNWLWFLK